MHVSGQARIAAPPERVFDSICDPAELLAVIPGAQEVRQVGIDEYHGRISMRLPAIVGTYATWVRLVDAERPWRGEIQGRVEGRPGNVVGRATFQLHQVPADDGGGTLLEYDGDAVVTGPLGHLDSRFLEGVARGLIGEGIERLGQRLTVDLASAREHAAPAASGNAGTPATPASVTR